MNKDMNFNGLFEEDKARFNHHRLLHHYTLIKKGAEAAKSKLELMKQRKLTLLAEVCFLRQRRKHLAEMKAANPSQKQKLMHHPISQSRPKSTMMQNTCRKKEIKLQKIALKINDTRINQKVKHFGNEAFPRNTKLGFDVNRKEGNYGAKEVTFKHPSEVRHWNRTERIFVGEKSNPQKDFSFDLNLMEKCYAVTKEAVQNRAPVFDLNLQLGEEDIQENIESSRSVETQNLFSGGSEEQPNDLKVSVCRNVETVANHSGKRKISWQDPVALKV